VKRWKFRKADLKRFGLLTGESLEGLSPPDTTKIEKACHKFCESLLFAAKQCIIPGRHKNCVSCWDKDCETLHRSFLRATDGTESDWATTFSPRSEEAV